MTDREKLIELLGEDTCHRDGCYDCDYDGDRNACIEYLKTSMADHLIANGATFQKWIPVSERLPENGDVVICFIKNGEQDMLQWDTFENTWVGKQWTYKRHAVTHWMPLPEPPKEDNK